MEELINLARGSLKKYVCIILSVSLLCCLGLTLERKFRSDVYVKSSNIHMEKNMSIQYDDLTMESANNVFDYSGYMNSFAFLNKFYESTKDKYDYSRICFDWNKKSHRDHLKWLQKHFWAGNFKSGVVQFGFHIDENEPKDYKYSKEVANELLNDYILCLEKDFTRVKGKVIMSSLGDVSVTEERDTIKKGQIEIKYGIIGILLGSILGGAICLVDILFKRNNNAKL